VTRHQAIRNCSLWDRLASRARPATRAQTGESDEAGAILVLALVFLVAVSVIGLNAMALFGSLVFLPLFFQTSITYAWMIILGFISSLTE